MLIDNVTIKISAGKGGNGAVAFNKSKMAIGPVGGNGGDGGSIYVEGVSDLSALRQFRFKKDIQAKDGENGRGQFVDGKSGIDITLKVPIGTVIHNLTTGIDHEILKTGEKILVARGGRGGKGNFLFRSSINTTPKEFEFGHAGQSFTLNLELKLIADVGFIGLPNAGKSSMLNELTNAKSKVANYPFTTLEPNLGVYYDLILADIPGLIEGASKGKGLGIKFLHHIERTRTLFHFISAESEDVMRDYKIIRGELGRYNQTLLKKPEYVFISKSDLADAKKIKQQMTELKKLKLKVLPTSIHDIESIEKIQKILNDIIKEKNA
jgi:GTP-binding protein